MAFFSAIGAAVAGAFGAVAGTVAFTFISGLTVAGLQIAAGIGLSLLGQALSGKPDNTRPFSAQVTLRSGDNYTRTILLGESITAGSLAYYNIHGRDNAYLVQVIALADMPIRELRQVYVDDSPVTFSSTIHPQYGTAINEYKKNGRDHLWVKFYDGNQTSPDSYLVSTFSGDADRPYSGNRVGNGIPYVIVTSRAPERQDGEEQPLFNGIPTLKFVTYGTKLYNPATGEVGDWGDFNPVVQLYNIMTGLYYKGHWMYGLQSMNLNRLPLDNWVEQINKAQTLIAGATPTDLEPTYRSGGELPTASPIRDVIDNILTSCQGRMAEVGGTYKIYVGEPDSPVYHFDDMDIISTQEQSFTPFFSLSDTINGISATYPNPDEGWNQKTAPPLIRPDLEKLVGDKRLMANVALDMVHYHAQVQRLMLSALKEAQRARRHTIVLGPEAFVLEPGDIITWTSARNGYVDKQFRVDGVGDQPNLDIIVDITEVDPSDYNWNPITDFTPIYSGPIGMVGPKPLPMVGWQVFPAIINDEQGRPRRPSIEVHFDGGLADVYSVRVQVRTYGESNIIFDGEVPYSAPHKVVLAGDFPPNTVFEVRGIFIRDSGHQAEWSAWLTVTTPNIKLIPFEDFDPYGGLVGFDDLENDLNDYQNWVGKGIRELYEQNNFLATLVSDQDLANTNQFSRVRSEIAIVDGANRAEWMNQVTVLLDNDMALSQEITAITVELNGNIATAITALTTQINDVDGRVTAVSQSVTDLETELNGNIATAISSLTTQINDVDGRVTAVSQSVIDLETEVNGTISSAITALQTEIQEVEGYTVANSEAITQLSAATDSEDPVTANFRMQTVTGPSGYARIGAQTRIGGVGAWRGAAWYLDTPANDTLPTRFVVEADQFIVVNGNNTAQPLVFESGVLRLNVANIGTVNAGIIQGNQVLINLNTGFFSFG